MHVLLVLGGGFVFRFVYRADYLIFFSLLLFSFFVQGDGSFGFHCSEIDTAVSFFLKEFSKELSSTQKELSEVKKLVRHFFVSSRVF